MIYTGGTIAHLFRLAVGFTWRDMPFFVDWVLVVLGPIGVVGLIRLKDEIVYRGRGEADSSRASGDDRHLVAAGLSQASH